MRPQTSAACKAIMLIALLIVLIPVLGVKLGNAETTKVAQLINTNREPPPPPTNQTAVLKSAGTFDSIGDGDPRSTPVVGSGGSPLHASSVQNHWWDITYFSQDTVIYRGDFVAKSNTMLGLHPGDANLILPLNVAVGSFSNLVWFQFDIQFSPGGEVRWFIWPIVGPTGCDDNLIFNYEEITFASPNTAGLQYIPGDSYHFELYPDGRQPNYMVFLIVNDSKGGLDNGAFWWNEWPVPSTNLVNHISCFSPAVAIEGYTDPATTTLTSVPTYRFKESHNIDNPMSAKFGSGQPNGVSQRIEPTGEFGVWDWIMYQSSPNPITADPQFVQTEQNTPINILLTANGGNGRPLSFSIVSPPLHGTLSGSGNLQTYTPSNNYDGFDSFSFTASDGTEVSPETSIWITVVDTSILTASPKSVTVQYNTAKVITLVGSDSDGDPLIFYVEKDPLHGTLSLVTGNKITYTPTTGFQGSDSFTFSVSDGPNFSSQAKVSITVMGPQYPIQ